MIVEMRSYLFHPGKAAEYLKLVEDEAISVQEEFLGKSVGYYHCDIGVQNQVIHMWAYENYADRERRRAELDRQPEWKAFQPKTSPLIASHSTQILVPAPFYTPKR